MLVFNPLTGGFDQVGTSSGGGSSGVSSVNGRTGAVTLTSTDVALGNVNNTSDANKPISTATATALGLKADLVSGFIPTSQIPAIAITEFLGTSNSQAAMLALSGQKGDWTIRSDTGATWIITGTDPTQLSNWTAISYPTSPVTSVNAQTGAVVLGFGDVGAQKAAATLTALAAMTTAADQLIYATGTDTFATTGFTAFGRSLVDDADAATARTTLQLVIGTNVQAFDADLSALAALSGTNTIYYRSAANTWTAVTVGSGLDFTAGTLRALGGGGGGGDVFLDESNVFTQEGAIIIDTGANGATDVEGIVMRNDTPATLSVQQQDAPSIAFESHCWAGDGEGGGVDDEWEMSEVFIATNTVAPTRSRLSWQWSHNGGAYAEKSYINSDGNIGAAGLIFGEALAVYSGNLIPGNPQPTIMSLEHGTHMISGSTTNSPKVLFTEPYPAFLNTDASTPIFFLTQQLTVTAYRFYGNSLTTGNLIECMMPSAATGNYLTFGSSTDGLSFTDVRFQVAASGAMTQTQLALGTTTQSGLLLRNTTTAAAGAQQVSPATRWTGQGWKTNSTAASQPVDFLAYVLPIQGASSASGEWRLDSSIGGVPFSNIFKITTAGAVSATSLTTTGHNTFEGVTATGATGTGKHVYSIAPAFTGQSAFTDTGEYPLNVLNNTISASQGIASFLASNLADGSSIFFTLGKSVTATNCATFSFTRNATTTSNRWSVGFFAADNLFNVFQSGGASLGNPGTTTDPGAGNLALAGYIQPSGQAVKWLSGSGSPDGAVAAPVGSLYTRTNGGTGTVLYVKETGAATNLGWAAK